MAKQSAPIEQNTDIFSMSENDTTIMGMMRRRAKEAEDHWESTQSLKAVRAENNKAYLGKYVEEKLRDERYEDIYLDNRQFTSIRTILPFLTARITQPEVTPADESDLSLYFAKDFEKAMAKHLQKQFGRAKLRMGVEDVLRGERVGIFKWVYNLSTNTVELKHCKPGSVVLGKRSEQFEEFDFIRHKLKRTVGDLIDQFPHKKSQILELFEIDRPVPSQLEREFEINEDWIWIHQDGKKKLIVGWNYNNFLFEKIPDPNWVENGKNIADTPMMPFFTINFLNNGSGYIDQTSFIEQAKYLQANYNKRGQTIADNAKYAGIGVPIFAKGSISAKDVAKVRFSPIQRILLKTDDMNKSFTTWQSSPLPQFIVEDKLDDRASIDNIWGANAVLRGQPSDAKTLGQDVLNRDQAEGRLSDPIDCIDDAMERCYLLEAQLMYRYFDDEHYYKYLGKDGKFVKVIVTQKRLAQNFGIEIGVVAGTSLPIDRAQERATTMELLKLNRVGTLTAYKKLGIFDDPESAYKEYVTEQADPQGSIKEAESAVFSREAQEDLAVVIDGKIPDERDDLPDEYITYLNEWMLTDKYKFLKPEEKQKVSQFADAVIKKARRKMIKLSMQVNPEPGIPSPGAPEPTAPAGIAPLQPDPTTSGLSQALQQAQTQPQAASAPA